MVDMMDMGRPTACVRELGKTFGFGFKLVWRTCLHALDHHRADTPDQTHIATGELNRRFVSVEPCALETASRIHAGALFRVT